MREKLHFKIILACMYTHACTHAHIHTHTHFIRCTENQLLPLDSLAPSQSWWCQTARSLMYCVFLAVVLFNKNVTYVFLQGNEECAWLSNSSVWWLCFACVAWVVASDILLCISWSIAMVFSSSQSCHVTGCFCHYWTEMCYALTADSARNECKIQPLPLAAKDKVW